MSRGSTEPPPSSRRASDQRRRSLWPPVTFALPILAVVGAAAIVSWLVLGGSGDEQRARLAIEPDAPRTAARADVDLVEEQAASARANGSSDAVDGAGGSSAEQSSIADDAHDTDDVPSSSRRDATDDGAHDRARGTGGPRATFELEIGYPGQIPSPRLPAWLELDVLASDAAPMRVLGTIEGDVWSFVVEDLEPGRIAWTARTAIAAPLTGDVRLEGGTERVRVELIEHPATSVRLAAEFPWNAAGARAAGTSTADAPESERTAVRRPLFGAAPPWLVLGDVTAQDARDDLVLVPFLDWHRAHWDVVPTEGPFERRMYVFGVAGRLPALQLVGGLPSTHDVAIGGEPGGVFVEISATASDRVERVLDLDLHWPDDLDADARPDTVDVVLYGSVPEDLATLVRPDGPRQFERRLVELEGDGSAASTSGRLRLDPRHLPRGLRVMVRADGFEPVFADLDAALATGRLDVEFGTGSGGVVLVAYQNHRAGDAHWAPGFGFECLWLPDSGVIEIASVTPLFGPLLPEGRAAPMGWIEFASPLQRAFDIAHVEVVPPHTNADRTARAIHASLAITSRDAAPGVIEVLVQD